MMGQCKSSWTETWPPGAGGDGTCPSCGQAIQVIDQGERGVIPAHEAKERA